MATRGKGARAKGANFERKVANDLTALTGVEFKRGLGQSRNGGKEAPDVYSDTFPWLHIECKNQKICNIKAAMAQAVEDIGNSDNIPVVVSRDTGKETLVTMRWDDWVKSFFHWAAVYQAAKEE